MKSLLLILLVSLGGSQASFSSSSRMNGRLTRSKLIKRPPIVFNVTSQTVFIDGCWATFTCTVTFDWTPQKAIGGAVLAIESVIAGGNFIATKVTKD
ncbi:MAG: hypothetical protein EOO03_04560 [Chitinophagaceae bacterium]|nr:MAG: hypothetical protein EOO03_04560 [Chitinophagaceae bacterium]